MLPVLFESTTIPVLEQVVRFAQERHGVLAGNLANMDTPGYQVRDLSPDQFQAQLREAIDGGRGTPTASPGEMAYDRFDKVKETSRSILYHDQSNVSLEQQVTQVAKNQMTHNLALTILTSQFQLLRAAISEQTT